jgi:hypothetical protein
MHRVARRLRFGVALERVGDGGVHGHRLDMGTGIDGWIPSNFRAWLQPENVLQNVLQAIAIKTPRY